MTCRSVPLTAQPHPLMVCLPHSVARALAARGTRRLIRPGLLSICLGLPSLAILGSPGLCRTSLEFSGLGVRAVNNSKVHVLGVAWGSEQ